METRGFSDAGLSRCGSTPKRPSPNPSGKSERHIRPDPVRDAVGVRPGFSESLRRREAGDFLDYGPATAGVGPRWNRKRVVKLLAFGLGCLCESDRLADIRSLVRTAASKTAGESGWSIRKVRKRKNVMRRIGAWALNDFPNCHRAGRRDAAGLDGADGSGASPAVEGAAR